MLDSLLHTGIVQNTFKIFLWVSITGIFFSGALVFLEGRLKKRWLRKSAYFFSFAGPLVLILMIISGSVGFKGTEDSNSLKLSSFNLDTLQAHSQINQALETIYVSGCWILLGGSLCSGLLMFIKKQLPEIKILKILCLFSLVGPILFIFLVWNKSLNVDDVCIGKKENHGIVIISEKAQNGDPQSQVKLGAMYVKGNEVPKNENEAAKWFKKAAEQGDSWGQANLGLAYLYGRGLTKNEVEAVRWLTKSAEQGLAAGQYSLGWCYLKGTGVEKNEKEAFRWFIKSAEQGNPQAQSSLGWCYLEGTGVEKNEKEAFKWFTKSAEQGNSQAQDSLGWCYLKGTGVEKNEKEAFKWFTKSAEQGNPQGQDNLGWCYLEGTGVEKNEKEAIKWFRKSANQGFSKALEGIKKAESTRDMKSQSSTNPQQNP